MRREDGGRGALAALVLLAGLAPGAAEAWWDPAWSAREQLEVRVGPNVPDKGYAGYTVRVVVDGKAWIAAGTLQPDCDDLRVVYGDGSTAKELPRHVVGCGTAATEVRFKLAADIAANGSDAGYYLYHGNPAAPAPAAPGPTDVYLWYDDASVDRSASYVHGRIDPWHGQWWDDSLTWDAAGYYRYRNDDNHTSGYRRTVDERDVYIEAEFYHTGCFPLSMTTGLLVRGRIDSGSGGSETSDSYYASNRGEQDGCGSNHDYPHDGDILRGERTVTAVDGPNPPAIATGRWRRQALAAWGVGPTRLKFWDSDAGWASMGWPTDAELQASGTDGGGDEVTGRGFVAVMTAQDQARLRNILVRRYVEPEPTVTLVGAGGGPVCSTTTVGTDDLKAVHGVSDRWVLAVGKKGQILEYDGAGWTDVATPTTEELKGIFALDTVTAFAVGDKGAVLRRGAGGWSVLPGPGTTKDLEAVWAYSAGEVYVAGKDGTLWRYDGAAWTDLSRAAGTGGKDDFKDLWGDASTLYALTDDGKLFWLDRASGVWRSDGASCPARTRGFESLWGGGGVLYLAGKDDKKGAVYRWDGASCTVVATALEDLKGIYGAGADRIVAVGKKGVVLSWDGAAWSETTEAGGTDLEEVWVSPSGLAYYAGKGGTVTVCSGAVPTLDHFVVDAGAGTASTCMPRAVTITAYDSSGAVLGGYTGTVSITTSAGHGDWSVSAGSGTLDNGGADDGAATYTFDAADGGSVVLELADVHADDLTITVADASAGVGSTSATVSFRDDAFVLTPTDTLGTEVVAGRGHGFKAELWRRDPVTGDCAVAAGYAGAVKLKAWVVRDGADPGGGGPAIGGTVLPDSAPLGNNIALTFVAGVAGFTLDTSDAGKYALALRDDESGFARDAAGNPRPIAGGSATLTVRPFGLSLEGIQAGGTANPGSTTPAGAVFAKAGRPFDVRVRAVIWQAADDADGDGVPDAGADLADNGTTPAFAWSTTLAAGAPYAPAGGALGSLARGGVGAPVVAASEYAAGEATVSDLGYSEVGAFTLGASASAYLGSAGVDVGAVGVTVGRFTPDHFDVALNTPAFDTFCDAGGFTYLGQPFGYATAPVITVTARNAQGGTTANYTGAWMRLTNASLGLPAYAAATGTLDLSGLPASGDPAIADLGAGTVTLTFSAGSGLRFDRSGGPVPPFDAEIALSLDVVDADGVAYAGNPARFGDASAGNGIAFDAGKSMRYGRLALDPAHGPELLPLQLPLRIEYWGDPDGDGVASFVTHADDACTTVAASAVSLSGYTGNLDPADLDGDGDGLPDVAVTLSAGAGSVALTQAPGAGNDGAAEVGVDAPVWLEYDWKGTGAADPAARATWGVYRGDDYRIYQRELY
ncbi:DUF6701 domain-containing protein [Inmirania thermothiophila]|uniref:DUF6701 domain-containing protein n=1 Tax=Inmirania thermothiophila TaxID=1750597 RepID=A0A3N1Y5V3_9GAMM|nr:DUF6701 domain-containing protein [Inmirania thermothiophila]ROR34194.1 hypothetical protein EDC57_0090 [Inmirania thermothiophila]